jgi:hypothetical protein
MIDLKKKSENKDEDANQHRCNEISMNVDNIKKVFCIQIKVLCHEETWHM